jgi:hypothetical protein
MEDAPIPNKQQHLYKVCRLQHEGMGGPIFPHFVIHSFLDISVQILVIGDYAVGKTSIIKRLTPFFVPPRTRLLALH